MLLLSLILRYLNIDSYSFGCGRVSTQEHYVAFLDAQKKEKRERDVLKGLIE
jgi:membrane protein required for beta-lactamase induction